MHENSGALRVSRLSFVSLRTDCSQKSPVTLCQAWPGGGAYLRERRKKQKNLAASSWFRPGGDSLPPAGELGVKGEEAPESSGQTH